MHNPVFRVFSPNNPLSKSGLKSIGTIGWCLPGAITFELLNRARG